MISLLTSILPVALGFIAKLIAVKSQASSDALNLAILATKTNNEALEQARVQSNKESPMAALNRRIIILVILSLLVFISVAPALLDIPTAVPIVDKGFSLLGLEITADKIEYEMVTGIVKMTEIYAFAELIISFYFGSQLAKAR
jgi:hypothetical protein